MGALWFAQSHAGGEQARDELAVNERLCDDAGAAFVAVSDDPDEGRILIEARRVAYTATERLGTTLLDDVAVPIPASPSLLDSVVGIAAKHEVLIGTCGHAGDGKMHPTMVFDHAAADHVARATRVFDEIVAPALDLGGTVSGEHGVGLSKTRYLDAELGSAREIGATIARALDPQGLFNPAKAI